MNILIKILKRIKSIIKKACWKTMFLNKFKCGINTHFYGGTHIVIDGGIIEIGNNCFFNKNCSINSMKKIKIGNDSIFGENVCMYDHNHRYTESNKLIREQGYNTSEIEIGNNCWIGSNVTILAGVKIGDNSIIGAGTIVYKSIPNNTLLINKQNIVMKNIMEDICKN